MRESHHSTPVTRRSGAGSLLRSARMACSGTAVGEPKSNQKVVW